MPLSILSPDQILRRTHKKQTVSEQNLHNFKSNLTNLLEKLKDHNREGKQETDVRDFLIDSFYKNRFYINKKETADWVIFNDEHGNGKVSVIIEMKSTQAKAEMLTETDQNAISLLNPKLSNWYFNKISTTTCEGINRWKKYKIEQFPIKSISQSNQVPFVEKVDEILNLKKADPIADTSQLEAEIDQMVYALYGLTDDEIAIVEGRN